MSEAHKIVPMATHAPSTREPAAATRGAGADGPSAPAEPTEAEIAAFGRWYESQPEDWVEFLDELGRNKSSKRSAR